MQCEIPNGNLHEFKGKLRVLSSEGLPSPLPSGQNQPLAIGMSEMLLRGTLLKNSGYVYGLVVYTGKETRIQMNAAHPPLKMGTFDKFLNFQIAIIIIVQCVLCVLLAMASYIWREYTGMEHVYLELKTYDEGNYENGAIYIIVNFITFWILTSYMVSSYYCPVISYLNKLNRYQLVCLLQLKLSNSGKHSSSLIMIQI